jgi:hypothetical protein
MRRGEGGRRERGGRRKGRAERGRETHSGSERERERRRGRVCWKGFLSVFVCVRGSGRRVRRGRRAPACSQSLSSFFAPDDDFPAAAAAAAADAAAAAAPPPKDAPAARSSRSSRVASLRLRRRRVRGGGEGGAARSRGLSGGHPSLCALSVLISQHSICARLSALRHPRKSKPGASPEAVKAGGHARRPSPPPPPPPIPHLFSTGGTKRQSQ